MRYIRSIFFRLKRYIKYLIQFIANIKSLPYYFLAIFNNTNVFLIKNGKIGHFPINFFLCLQLYKKKAIFATQQDFVSDNSYIYKKFKENYVFDNRYLGVPEIMEAISVLTFGLLKFNKMPEQSHMTEEINFAEIMNPDFKIFQFTNTENNIGKNFLSKHNINPNKFICLLVRTSEYNISMGRASREQYQHKFRNVNPKIFIPSIHFLIENNYTVVRMGKGFTNKFPYEHKNFIDYAVSDDRDDFLDIWLSAHCSFFLHTNNGIGELNQIFYKPNLTIGAFPYGRRGTAIPKSICLFRLAKKDGKILNLKELIQLDLISRIDGTYYKEIGVEVLENDPEDILQAVKQMEKNCKEDTFVVDERNMIFWEKMKKEWDSQLKLKNNNLKHKFTFQHFHKLDGINTVIADVFLEKYLDHMINC